MHTPDALARRLVVLGLLVACGCGPAFPTPFTAEQMSRVSTGAALAHYLAQDGATAAVCHRAGKGPRFRGATAADFTALTMGLVAGSIRPELWQRCATFLLGELRPGPASLLVDELAHGYRQLLSGRSLEQDPQRQEQLEALHQVLLQRPAGAMPHADAVAADIAALREALAIGALGPVATKYGRDLLVSIDLERGIWRGAPLTLAVLDGLQADGEEEALRRIARRVPAAELRRAARQRIVRLHLANATSPDVRAHADEIEARVMATGRNAVDPAVHAPVAAWLADRGTQIRGVLVRQDLAQQTVTLLGYGGDRPGSSLVPSLALRGLLFVKLAGFAEPLTLCATPEALDVTPCLLPAALRPLVPVVYVDGEGLLHFVERIAARDAVRLVYETLELPVPFAIAGKTVLTLEWKVVFEPPPPLAFTGPAAGRGPDLRVVIERRYSERILFEVAAPAGQLVGVVEAADLGSFAVVTRGGPGQPGARGSDGADGTPGSAGMTASCPSSPGTNGGNGGPGGNGGAGGPGGPGGPGGDVVVHVACVKGDCGDVTDTARALVRSDGGAGGPGGEGGRGGRGGAGGPGGSGTSCIDAQGHSTYLSGGSPGTKGADGSPGARGASGPDGEPGTVRFR